jgi:hypothetical protein
MTILWCVTEIGSDTDPVLKKWVSVKSSNSISTHPGRSRVPIRLVLPLKSGPTRTMSFDMKEDRYDEEEAQA